MRFNIEEMKENIWTTGLNILELISSTLSPILRDITITSKLEYLRNNGRHKEPLFLENYLE